MPRYTSDESLEKLAVGIIRKNHKHLIPLKIAYMFREEASISEGKVVAGMAIKVDDRNWVLHKVDAMVEIAKDVWLEATEDFRNALMDHELSHIGIRTDEGGTTIIDENSGRVKIFINHHDIEEFTDVLERHGAYHKNLRTFLLKWTEKKLELKKKGKLKDGEETE